jgi:hypothetical protein
MHKFKKGAISVVSIFLLFGVLVSSTVASSSIFLPTTSVEPELYINTDPVTGIELHVDLTNQKAWWETTGHSAKGFKIVWSKNEAPTYPTRSGDKYIYLSSPSAEHAQLTPFSGDGKYYVRVCEYLGGACGLYSNEMKITLGSGNDSTGVAVCTKEYRPVCGSLKVQCVTIPCDPVKKTYSNKCMMEAAGASFISSGVCGSSDSNGQVKSIKLTGAGLRIKWEADNKPAKGYKVVWSKYSKPTYPTRSGDKYHYFSDPDKIDDILTPFSGDGKYYIRVCEYLGGACGTYSNEIELDLSSDGSNDLAVCTMEYAPVCGVNGKTYSNKCQLRAAKVDFKYYGKCRDGSAMPGMYSYAKWTCSNGEGQSNTEESSCKSQEIWKSYAKEYCGENEVSFFAVEKECSEDSSIADMKNKAYNIANNRFDDVLKELAELRNLVKEQQIKIEFLTRLKNNLEAITSKVEGMLNNFIAYGVDDNTKKIGERERAAVLFSYKDAFKKLPENEEDMADVIKIANGRWPDKRNKDAEEEAGKHFKKIYKKVPDMKNSSDNAAITVMAYGLRQKAENRNLDSERQGIKIFMDIYGYHPNSTEDWNVMQAITYSGSKRGLDDDRDLLINERELEIGTDPNNPDTDGDGYLDGMEVANGFDPLNP